MTTKSAIWLLLSSLAVVWLVDFGMSFVRFSDAILTSDLSELQAKQIDIYVQVTQQFLTFATLLLAGVGLFIDPDQRSRTTGPLWPLALVAIAAAASMYFGYLSLNATIWMLSKKFFNLQNPVLRYAHLAQYWTFAVAVLLFAWFWLTQRQFWSKTP